MNKIILIGRISTDLELKQLESGSTVCKFNLAVNRYKEGVDFIPIQVWNKQADNLVQYQTKGSQIAVEGSIRIDNYQNAEGENRRSIYVLANNVQFLGNKQSQEQIENDQTDEESNPFEEFGEEIEIEDNFLE